MQPKLQTMTTLTPNTQLQRISKLDIQLKGNDSIRLKWGRKHLKAEVHTLAILNAFSQPKTFAAGLLQVAQTENCDETTLSNTFFDSFTLSLYVITFICLIKIP